MPTSAFFRAFLYSSILLWTACATSSTVDSTAGRGDDESGDSGSVRPIPDVEDPDPTDAGGAAELDAADGGDDDDATDPVDADESDDVGPVADARVDADATPAPDSDVGGPEVTDALNDVAEPADTTHGADSSDLADIAEPPDTSDVTDVIDPPDTVDAADVADADPGADIADVTDATDVAGPQDVADVADVIDPPDSTDTGEPPVCEAPDTLCGSDCVSLQTSSAHCGRCNGACPTWQSCRNAVCSCTNDIFEPNNTAATATRLPTGDLRPGSGAAPWTNVRLCPADEDWFRVDVAGASGDLVVELTGDCTSSTINPVIELVTDTASPVASASSGGTGGCPRLSTTLTRGQVRFIRLRATHSNASAALQLSVHFTAFRETSGNESLAAASGTWHRPFEISAFLDDDASDRVDFFRVDLHYAAAMSWRSSTCGVEHDLELLASDGTRLQGPVRSGTCASVSRTMVPGTYYIRAFPRSAGEWGSYRLTMTGAPAGEVEPNATPAAATVLGAVPSSGEGALAWDDLDAWRFTHTAGQALRIQTRGPLNDCDTDTAVELWSADGATLIARSSDGGAAVRSGTGNCAELRASTTPALAGLASGNYVIVVRTENGAQGPYLLNVLTE